jgi:hypothetical protein
LPVCGFWLATVCGPNCPYALVAGLCDETEPECDLRFEVDEEYVRELIDRIDEMSLRGKNRCTEKHPGKWEGKPGECGWNLRRPRRRSMSLCLARQYPIGGAPMIAWRLVCTYVCSVHRTQRRSELLQGRP